MDNTKTWREEFDDKFVEYQSDYKPYIVVYKSNDNEKVADIKSFIEKVEAAAFKRGLEETIGKIGAELLARHSPQAVLDAYFEVANEELEKVKEQNETNN